MQTIGLIGGMSWESTVTYYQMINEGVKAKLGGLHSAKICLYSVEFGELEKHMQAGDWAAAAATLCDAAKRIETAGADFLLICTNTMHKVADEVQDSIGIPLLHIADATAQAIKARKMKTIGLLGTRYTMEKDFYKGRLSQNYGLNILVPGKDERSLVNRIIFEELCLGKIRKASRSEYLKVIEQLADKGAEAVILGCTEIALLVKPEDTPVPLFDTTKIHAEKAVAMALSDVP